MNKFLVLVFIVFSFLLVAFACLPASETLAQGCVDINTATLEQLKEITQIGDARAQAIINARPFSSVNDLSRVKGIGDGIRLQKIKDQGLASVNCGMSDVPKTDVPPTEAIASPELAMEISSPAPIAYPTGVYINEVLPNPEGADEQNEWIELYNSNNVEVDLSGWQIQDTNGTVTTYTLPSGSKILANGYLVLKRPETKILLNNDEDGINLLTPDKKIIDSVNFPKAPLGQSYNKTASGWQWSTSLTPASKNIIPTVSKAPSKNSKNSGLPSEDNSVTKEGVELGLAGLSQATNINQTKSPWFLFFIVLAVTIILAIIVLLIKLRFTEVTKP